MLAVEILDVLATFGLVGVNSEARISVLDCLDEFIGLLECVKGVQIDQIDVGLDRAVKFRYHVVDGKSSESKGSSLEQTGQSHDAPLKDI